ncbi:MAG TPA: diadenylate cyclase CdaA [Bryobacteraceae bacterium]|nr:diadenylate cyclase CdaA [Bryobacteraceae bacterium]
MTPELATLPRPTLVSIVDILIVAFLIYQFLMIVRGRRAAHILNGALILVFIYAASVVFKLELLRSVLEMAAPYAPFALIVMFQSEIRRVLAQIGRRRWMTLGGSLKKREFADEMVLALTQLAQQKTGALVVLERDIGLRTFIESGVLLDATLSRDLLLSIFQDGSALHDGAVIVQNNRIAAAACFLPLSVKPALARELGTRHRAGIGVTEETDCIALIVSEETGNISVAAFGELEIDVTPRRLEERIAEHLIHKRRSSPYRDALKQAELGRQAAHDAHIDG